MKILGTNLCSECQNAKIELQLAGIKYEYTNFTDSIEALKEFIRFRDTHKEFDTAKINGKIGVPGFVFEDGEIVFNVEDAIQKLKHS